MTSERFAEQNAEASVSSEISASHAYETEIHGLIYSNDPPMTEDLRRRVQQRYDETGEALVLMRSRLQDLEATMGALRSEIAAMEKSRTQLKTVMSPVRRLPHDVLACIFDFYTLDLREGFTDLHSVNAKPPWVLGLICRGWRSSALSLPRLWNLVSSPLPNSQLDEQLKRCQDISLSVALQFLPTMFAITGPLLCSKPPEMTPRYWSHASLYSDSVAFEILAPYKSSFHPLQELSLYFMDDEWVRDYAPRDVFWETPNLRTLSFYGANVFTHLLHLPWGQILDFTSKESQDVYPTVDNYYPLLPKLANVEICWLECIISTAPRIVQPPSSPTILRALHTLSLTSSNADQWNHRGATAKLLDAVTLPTLRKLTFYDGLCWSSRSLIAMISRSDCTLIELTLLGIRTADEVEFETLLRSGSLKMLKSLSLGFRRPDFDPICHNPRNLLSLLTRRSSEIEDDIPVLQRFETENWDLCRPTMVQFLSSRRGFCRRNEMRLEKIVLRDLLDESGHATRVEFEDKIKVMGENGLVHEWKARRY